MAEQGTTSRNQNFHIQELAAMVRNGKIRVPEFQRSFRWSPTDVLTLFDSILKGYPFGGLLLWRRPAPKGNLTIGAIEVRADAVQDAYWVIDGQQRVTSLVNAVDPFAGGDDRFSISYAFARRKFVLTREVKSEIAIPLPDLFDLSRAFAWLQANPDAGEYAGEIQRVTGLLRDVEVPASVIEEGEEQVLRDIFDRINTAGRRLRGSEIFDAIHSASGSGRSADSIPAIADRLDTVTEFGRLADQTIYQAILLVRHPDLSRNIRAEFTPEREAPISFPDDNQVAAYRRGEEALRTVISFLQRTAGVPHNTFVPFRFHLLVLARFFAHFPNPEPRNLELLSRWVWRSTAMAADLGYTGSTANIRTLANLVNPGDESGSVQRLLLATKPAVPVPAPDLHRFRTNNSGGKVVLAALWSLGPINPATEAPLSFGDLATALENETSAKGAAVELASRVSASEAANRALAIVDRSDLLPRLQPEWYESHLLDDEMIDALAAGDREAFLERREHALSAHVARFLRDRTGSGLETTPPLSVMDFDDLDELDEDSVSIPLPEGR
jgi:hypothetical protein